MVSLDCKKNTIETKTGVGDANHCFKKIFKLFQGLCPAIYPHRIHVFISTKKVNSCVMQVILRAEKTVNLLVWS